ncbi:MAG: hypothetical protein ACOYJD_01040 [Christensenellales bacterium]|jgi:hypothetical protein
MYNLLAVLYAALFFASGQVVSRHVFHASSPAIRLWLGGAAGLLMLIWLPALFSFLLGFTLLAQLIAAAVAAALLAILYPKTGFHLSLDFKRLKLPLILCALLTAFCAFLLHTHTLLERGGALYCGQSTYGDMPLHLGFITSISTQGFFPPVYSILPGTAVGYPFLSDSVSSTFLTLGATLKTAYILPMIWALFVVFAGAWAMLSAWLKNRRATIIAYVLFFLGSGFGFIYFLDGARLDPNIFTRIFTAFYEMPTNLVGENIVWVNVINDMLVPQRATLFGWAMLFPCLYLLYKSAFEGQNHFIQLSVFAGLMPLIHTHSFLALAIISAAWCVVYFIRKGWRDTLSAWLPYLVIVLILALPQLIAFTFKQSSAEGFIRPHFNWINEKDPWLWFYIKNIGIPFILLLPALVFANRRDRRVYTGAALIWLICEFVVFQPNLYDNNKLLLIWHFFTCGIVGKLLAKLYRRMAGIRGRGILAATVMFFCVFSSMLSLTREVVSEYQQFSADHVAASEYIKDNAPADALFLTADNHNNAVSSLTGRNIVCGTPSFLFFHGINYNDSHIAARLMFDSASFDALNSYYDVDYVFISSYERTFAPGADFDFSRYKLWYENGDIKIYAISERAL